MITWYSVNCAAFAFAGRLMLAYSVVDCFTSICRIASGEVPGWISYVAGHRKPSGLPLAQDGRPSAETSFSADSNWLNGFPVFAASSAITLLARIPSGIATLICTRDFGLVIRAHARAAPMCLRSLK